MKSYEEFPLFLKNKTKCLFGQRIPKLKFVKSFVICFCLLISAGCIMPFKYLSILFLALKNIHKAEKDKKIEYLCWLFFNHLVKPKMKTRKEIAIKTIKFNGEKKNQA